MSLSDKEMAATMLAPEPGSSMMTVAAVIHACAHHYGIAPGLLTEPDGGAGQRQSWIARKRQLAMYLSRELTEHSIARIGSMFGGRHHTTVMHACGAVRSRIETDDFTRGDVRSILRRLGVVELKKRHGMRSDLA